MTYGLKEQPGDPQKYRQCGPNNRVWVVPCVSRALFDPVNKVCKEQSHIHALLSIRRKSGKSVEARERDGTKLQPLTEEFLFSTKKPKNNRPRIKPTSTASSTLSPSTNLPSSTKTLGRFPTPPPFDFLSTTTRPLIPAMESTQELNIPPTVTPSMIDMEPLGPPGLPSIPARSNSAPPAAHTVSYKGITMSEEEFLKQLVRIVEAHQLAISKIKEQVEQERIREKAVANKSITENYRKQGTAGNHGGEASQMNTKELERQSMELQRQRERVEHEWQEELAKQKSAEEELKSQQEYAEKLAKTQHLKKMLAWQRELAQKKAELEKKEKELAERQKQIEEKLRQEEDARKTAEEKQRQLQVEEKRKQDQEMKKKELARQKAEMEKKKKEKQEKTRMLAEKKKEEERREQERKKAEDERKRQERQRELARLKAERLQREKEEEARKERKKLEEEHLIEVERIRLEMEREMEEEARRMAEMAASEERNGSSSDKSSFRIHNSDEHMTGGNNQHTAHENKVIEAVMSGLMASKSGQTTMEPEVEIMRFTVPPPTPSSPENEWVTSPHSWRPAPDVQTNQLEWSQAQIPSTGTSELPSKVLSKCSPVSECDFNYEEDLLCPHPSSPNLYLQCTPWIGIRGRWAERMCPPNLVFMPYYGRCGLDVEASFTHRNTMIPRLPSDPEFIQWRGNKDLQQNTDTTQTPYNYLVTEEVLQPIQVVTRKPIYKIIEEFPQDLLPSSDVQNSFFPVVYEPKETPTDSGLTFPLFPMIEPDFLVPFEKFQDEFNEDTSFIGSIVKPAVKKIALDQAETFLDRILSDDVESRGETSTRSVSTLSSEDGWR
ncbi:unnamed protein product [Cylicocyclus nassatus]|uniref:Uncharacterized protein n=1 Tax=Cylicocyclus nassatus TaxID=53992 RepID=A0AA36GRR4_CYLNA|nr:unnamed protein product [Cylicocyclus nassatus]